MDTLDEQILAYLKADGRAAYTDIADELDVSEGTIRNRVQQLQADGVIQRFTVEIADSEAIAAVVMASVDPAENISEIIHSLPDETQVYEVTGDWDLVLHLSRPSSEALNQTLERIRKVNGVTETTTYTVLTSHTK